jgi:hypothetical protein
MPRRNQEEFPNGIDADGAVQWFRQMDHTLLRTAEDAQVAEFLGKKAFKSLRQILLRTEVEEIEDWPPGYICQLWQALQNTDSPDRQTMSSIFLKYQEAVRAAQNEPARSAGATYPSAPTSSLMRRLMDALLKHCRKT